MQVKISNLSFQFPTHIFGALMGKLLAGFMITVFLLRM